MGTKLSKFAKDAAASVILPTFGEERTSLRVKLGNDDVFIGFGLHVDRQRLFLNPFLDAFNWDDFVLIRDISFRPRGVRLVCFAHESHCGIIPCVCAVYVAQQIQSFRWNRLPVERLGDFRDGIALTFLKRPIYAFDDRAIFPSFEGCVEQGFAESLQACCLCKNRSLLSFILVMPSSSSGSPSLAVAMKKSATSITFSMATSF